MIATLTLLAALSLGQTPADIPSDQKVYGLSVLWKEASDHFAFFDKVPDLDWDKAYRDAIPRVLATTSKGDYYRELRRFYALLKDSHTDVTFPKDVAGGSRTPPIGAMGVGKRSFIASVPKPVDQEIPLRSEIVAVEGKPTFDYFMEKWRPMQSGTDRQVINGYMWLLLAKPPGQEIHFTVVTPQGVRKEVTVSCDSSSDFLVSGPDGKQKRIVTEKNEKGVPIYVTKPGPAMDLGPYALVQYKDLGGGIAYVRLNTFVEMEAADEFDKLVPQLAKAKGIVLDLRYNGGGNDEVGMRIAKHFTRGTFKTFASRSRVVVSAYRAWGKWVKADSPNLDEWSKKVLKHYQGTAWEEFPPQTIDGKKDAELLMPTVVLIGQATASAAEDTVIYFNQIPTATTVGQATFGGTGQPYIFDLPGGGSARVCTHRCTLPDGREFVGPGIQPKVPVEVTIDDIFAGRDPTMVKGVDLLRAKIGS